MTGRRVAANVRILFASKVTCNKFRGTRDCDYGWQENIGSSRVYVMHFSIRDPVAIRLRGLEELKAASRNGQGQARSEKRSP